MLHLNAAHFGDINFDLSGLSGDKKDCTCALCQRDNWQDQLRVSLPRAEVDLPETERQYGRHPLQHYFCLTTDTPDADSQNLSAPSGFGYSLSARS